MALARPVVAMHGEVALGRVAEGPFENSIRTAFNNEVTWRSGSTEADVGGSGQRRVNLAISGADSGDAFEASGLLPVGNETTVSVLTFLPIFEVPARMASRTVDIHFDEKVGRGPHTGEPRRIGLLEAQRPVEWSDPSRRVGLPIGDYRQPDPGVPKCVGTLRGDDTRPEPARGLARRFRAGGFLRRETAQD